MNWIDEGFLINKNKYSENSLIAEIYTKDHGKVVGIIFGGTSKKIKNYLQIGNKLHVNYNSKNENKIGYIPSGFFISILTADAAIRIPPNKAIQSPEFCGNGITPSCPKTIQTPDSARANVMYL